jgi:hypothetical protein
MQGLRQIFVSCVNDRVKECLLGLAAVPGAGGGAARAEPAKGRAMAETKTVLN